MYAFKENAAGKAPGVRERLQQGRAGFSLYVAAVPLTGLSNLVDSHLPAELESRRSWPQLNRRQPLVPVRFRLEPEVSPPFSTGNGAEDASVTTFKLWLVSTGAFGGYLYY
jgi:hypothetical protein